MPRLLSIFTRPLLVGAALLCPTLRAADSPEGLELFEKRIRPSLLADCVECHGAEKQKGGLRVDSRDALRKGGDTGAGVVPGKPADSLLLTAIKHLDPDMKMPSKAPKLSDELIRDYQRWIELGAPDPRDHPPTATEAAQASWEQKFNDRKQWWCFQPIRQSPIPPVQDAAWSDHPVDRFILSTLDSRGLAPTGDADAATLIRRLSYTLTGLPPTPEETTTFVEAAKTSRASAIAAATDRLLASPHFGEQWARHWMDLVRYADTHGSEGDPEIPGAWRYRDYLIRALNSDVPVDQLIREHLAGDILPNPRWNGEGGFNESAIGTAHIRMVEHGFQPVDTRDEQIKTLDSQIDVAMKAFQALTVSCARCHDHKFDPVSQHDYYALQGIFANARPAMVSIDDPNVAQRNCTALAALKSRIKTAIVTRWMQEAASFPKNLEQVNRAREESRALATKIASVESQLSELDSQARVRLSAERGQANLPVVPAARWSFDDGARDSAGQLDGTLVGNAKTQHGRLILDGMGSYLRTAPLAKPLREKTLEAWLSAATLDQRGGGVISVEDEKGSVFDSVVYAEKEAKHWVAGSNFFRRGQDVGGPEETARPDQLIHIAIVWGADRWVTIYRNGAPYGTAYQHRDLEQVEFAAGKARVLLGLRHTPSASRNGCFAGEIEEARLYDHALTANQIAASFATGPDGGLVRTEDLVRVLTADERTRRTDLQSALKALRTELARAEQSSLSPWIAAVADADSNPANPLHPWVQLQAPGAKVAGLVQQAAARHSERAAAAQARAASTRVLWDPKTTEGAAAWFRHGNGVSHGAAPNGELVLRPGSDRFIDGLFPSGFLSHGLTTRHAGIVQSPRFKVETKYISIHAAGRGGAQFRLISDGYPLGSNGGLFPRAVLDRDEPNWITIDVSYRKGAWSYLEFATRDDLSRIYDKKSPANDPSWFAFDAVVAHDVELKFDEPLVSDQLLAGAPITSAADFAARLASQTRDALTAWQQNKLGDDGRILLQSLLRRNLLSANKLALPNLKPLLDEYQRLESEITEPQRIPGVLEADTESAPFLPRGDHLKPGELVPRAFLSVVNPQSFGQGAAWSHSGRLELAHALTDPRNPLTARVFVNRVWHWLFGRGIVATPDNFGRMGERPSHPELLDYLAARFSAPENAGGFDWSVKKLVQFLTTTRTYALASTLPPRADEIDPGNAFLSHARLRRLDAEPLRDTLLTLSGQLSAEMYGPGDNALTRPQDQKRRSVYLTIRRNALSPFLTVFDSPKPFSTTGRRDETNVPAQSLTLLNDAFVIHCAQQWADRVRQSESTVSGRLHRFISEAFQRPIAPEEEGAALAFLQSLAQDRSLPANDWVNNGPLWHDFAHSLINAKEFVYLR